MSCAPMIGPAGCEGERVAHLMTLYKEMGANGREVLMLLAAFWGLSRRQRAVVVWAAGLIASRIAK